MRRDHVDIALEQAAREIPGLDVSPAQVTARIWRVSRFLELAAAAELASFGLGIADFDALVTLRRQPGGRELAPSRMAESAMLSPATITGQLDRLVAAGYVRRRRDPSDRRGVLIGLTPKGREVIDEVFPPYRANLDRLIAPLSEQERTRLAALLRKLLLAFEAEATGGAGSRQSAPP